MHTKKEKTEEEKKKKTAKSEDSFDRDGVCPVFEENKSVSVEREDKTLRRRLLQEDRRQTVRFAVRELDSSMN